MLDDSGQLTKVRTNVNPPEGVAKGPGLGESPKPYEEEGADKRVKELSVRMSPEKDEDEEDKKLDLVLGELVKIINDSDDEIQFIGRDTLYNATIR